MMVMVFSSEQSDENGARTAVLGESALTPGSRSQGNTRRGLAAGRSYSKEGFWCILYSDNSTFI